MMGQVFFFVFGLLPDPLNDWWSVPPWTDFAEVYATLVEAEKSFHEFRFQLAKFRVQVREGYARFTETNATLYEKIEELHIEIGEIHVLLREKALAVLSTCVCMFLSF